MRTTRPGEQNKLWQMVDELYARQGVENSGWINDATIASAAKAAGANVNSISAAFLTAPVTKMWRNAETAATTYAVRGTPTFVVQRPPALPDPAAALRPGSGLVRGRARSAAAVRLRASIAAAALVGAAIAAYLTYVHYSHTAPICVNSGCETVQKSKYAELAGVPVALLGLIAYVAIIATTAVRGTAAAFAGVLLSLRRRCVQRLPALGAARPDRSDLPVVPRERRRDHRRCGALCRADADRAPAC